MKKKTIEERFWEDFKAEKISSSLYEKIAIWSHELREQEREKALREVNEIILAREGTEHSVVRLLKVEQFVIRELESLKNK